MTRLPFMVICTLLLSAYAGADASAQSRAETRNYLKAVEKADIKSYDNFLKRYPESVYCADILARKDTILNISPYGMDEAAGIMAQYVPEGQQFRAFGRRKDAVDRIYALSLPQDSLDFVQVLCIEKTSDGKWKEMTPYLAYCADAHGMDTREIVDSCVSYDIRGERFFQMYYLLSSHGGNETSYVGVCYGPDSGFIGSISFTGKPLPSDGGRQYRISGRSNESIAPSMDQPQMRLLAESIRENPALEEIPMRDYLTDLSIQWWIQNNPGAMTDATDLKFNILSPESSLVMDFASAGGKQQSARYSAVIMDIRGYSVIVVYQKEDGNYVLAWAEPESRDHMKDRLLNDIRFIDANTLNVHFYHGRRDFSYKLNLSSKKVRR